MDERIVVVKGRAGKTTEYFDAEKLHRSIVATCRSLKTPDGHAEEIAEAVTKGVAAWARNKQEITSGDIRRIGAGLLQTLHPEAAYLYKQQLTVL